MLVGNDDIVSWRKPFNTGLSLLHTCCRGPPTKAAVWLDFENFELQHGVVRTEIESQAGLAVHWEELDSAHECSDGPDAGDKWKEEAPWEGCSDPFY
jgi:hypothetical protein